MRRFMILADARTGSNLLAQALDSHPRIRCFREVFNWTVPSIDFGVDGFDPGDREAIALRQSDPLRFLSERIFGDAPAGVHAVGFKLIYAHIWGYPGLLEGLVADTELDILHLHRRNHLRKLVSLRLAERSGEWVRDGRYTGAGMPGVARTLRHPVGALRRALRRVRAGRARSTPLRLTIDECRRFFFRASWAEQHFAELFAGHRTHDIWYRELLATRTEALAAVEDFLGVEHAPVTISLQRQNPAPLEDLIENYDEVRRAFRGTPAELFFSDALP